MAKLALALLFCSLALCQGANTKISQIVQQQLQVPGAAPQVMVIFKDNSVVYSQLRTKTFTTDLARTTAVIDSLKAFSAASQKNALAILNANAKTASAHKSFWISNSMVINGADAATISHLAGLPEVIEIREPRIAHISPAIVHPESATLVPEWGIAKTNAPQVHANGNTGEGIIVSTIDTGALYTHEALTGNYVNDAYSWYDPYTTSETPIDSNGHGTHVVGTIAGSHDIGMAPGAKWIACRGCDTASCGEVELLACGQFIACPHLYNDNKVCDPRKKPHVVNNSWAGGQGDTFYDSVIDAWLELGIVPVFANGNSGAFCGTANSPADNVKVIAVGNTDSEDKLNFFSSCGPPMNGNHFKPDIAAPGTTIRSAYNTGNDQYASLSGTSMASPHVAGGVALFLSANPGSDFAAVKAALFDNARKSELGTGAGTCGGIPETQFPNHSFGNGVLDILASINN